MARRTFDPKDEGLVAGAADREVERASGRPVVDGAWVGRMRARVTDGYYDDAAVLDALADRIVDSGDLELH